MRVSEALRAGTERLAATSDTARLDAELLMAHALGVSRSDLLLKHTGDAAPDGFAALIERRAKHEPVAYITGWTEFYGLRLQVEPGVLIPRGDSETLIEAAREVLADAPPRRVLDLGIGSGALLLAALDLWPEAQGTGIDDALAPIRVTDCNARKLGMAERVRLFRRDWSRPGWDRDLGQFDLILANPPYVEADAALDPDVRDYEPASALFAGAEGLDDYRVLIPQLPALLNDGGIAVVEIGFAQADAVSQIAAAAGLSATLRHDLGNRPRALVLRLGLGKA